MTKKCQLLLVPKDILFFAYRKVSDIFYWTDSFFTSHGLRTGIFCIDCTVTNVCVYVG